MSEAPVPHVTDQASGLPPGRYGTPRKTPRWVIVALAVVGLAALVPILLSAVDKATPEIRGTLTSYDVVDAFQVRVIVDIAKPDGQAATCTVQARNFYSDVVGSATVSLGAAAPEGIVTRTFPTSDKAVVVEVTECSSGSAD